MTETPDENPYDGVGEEDESPLIQGLLKFTGCIGSALPDLCSYGLTTGEFYVPFLPTEDDDCDEDDAYCSQAWVRVTNVGLTGTSAESWQGDRCGQGEMSIGLEVGVLRCFVIPEGGEAPTALETMSAALQAIDDMNTIMCAAMNCETWDSIDVGEWTPIGPAGGQHGGSWTFTVTPA